MPASPGRLSVGPSSISHDRASCFRRLPETGGIELLRAEHGDCAPVLRPSDPRDPVNPTADHNGGHHGDDDSGPHFRSFDEYMIETVEQGMVRASYGSQSTLLLPGVVLLIEPGTPTARTPVGPGPSRVRSMLVPARIFSAGRPGQTRVESRVLADAALASRFLDLHTRLLTPVAMGSGAVATGDQLLSLLSELVSRLTQTAPAAVPPPVEPRRIRVVREHLASHLTAPASLDQLSDLVGVSPFYLQRTFKAATRMSPREYLMDLRIRRARQLLREGQSPRAVGAAVGFFDQSHFTRAFRKLTGVTPGAYGRNG